MDLLDLEADLDRALRSADDTETAENARVMHAQPVDCEPRPEALQAIGRAAELKRRRAHRTYQQTLEAYKEEHKHEWSR